MDQAHARVLRADEDHWEPEPQRAATRDRRPERALAALDLDLGFGDESATGPHRRPRRPSGAAADYARGSSTERRTVRISGYGAQTALRPTPSERRGPRPDRVAGWAVAFGLLLALLAAATAHSQPAPAGPASPAPAHVAAR
jgi:hypothetical protein